jgi:large subunit ribosomal protein L10
MANKTIIAAKEEAVKKLAADLKESKLVLLVDYSGTSVEDDTKLRKDLRGVNGTSTVIKNNIIRRALEANGVKELDESLEGPTAIISSKEDYLSALKIAFKFSETHENYKFKGGIVEGEVKTAEELLTLAKLPSREELLSSLAGSLLGIISKFAVAINQVKELKEKEEGAPAPTEEVKEEAAEEVKEEATEEVKEEAKVDETPKAE